MKLNGTIDLIGYFRDGERVCFELGCGLDEAAALDGQVLTVTDDGDVIEVFSGYSIVELEKTPDGTTRTWCARELDDATKKAIEGLEKTVSGLGASISEANKTAASAEQKASEASTAAAEAKVAAESAGTDPQVATVAKLTAASIDFETVSATDCVAIPDYIPEWEPGMKLGKNAPVWRNGQLYRTSQAIASAQEQYPPETAGESMYYPVDVDEDGIIIYRECHGEYDMVRKGEKRHYPGAGDPVYVALEDTAYSPDAYPQHWELDGGSDPDANGAEEPGEAETEVSGEE